MQKDRLIVRRIIYNRQDKALYAVLIKRLYLALTPLLV